MGYGNGFIDGMTTITPMYGVTADSQYITVQNVAGIESWNQQAQSVFQSATGGKVIDLAIEPARPALPYLIAGSKAVWMLDTLSGNSSRFAALPEQPARLIFGGRGQNLFVLGAQHLFSLDLQGRVVQRVLAPSLDAIAFDDVGQRLVGLSVATRKLTFYDTSLRPQGSVALPKIAGKGNVSLTVNPKDGAIWLHRDGATDLMRLRLDPATGGWVTASVHLDSARNPTGLDVNMLGHVFVTDGGVISEFDSNGRRVVNSLFAGRPGGEVVHLLHSFSNFDPTTMTGPRIATSCRRKTTLQESPRPASRRNIGDAPGIAADDAERLRRRQDPGSDIPR